VTVIWLSQIVLLVMLSQSQSSEQLVGRWDAERRSRGGLGTILTLSEGGRCTKTTGAMVDGRWAWAAGQLTIVLTEDGKSDKQVITATVTGNTMTQLIEGERRVLKRVSPPGRVAIEGVWSYPHYAGTTAYDDYEPDGRFLFRLPMRTDPCSWAANGNHLKLIMDGEVDFKWEITEGRLTLEHGGERLTFHRENSILPSAKKPSNMP
jgi:hypothetical protein